MLYGDVAIQELFSKCHRLLRLGGILVLEVQLVVGVSGSVGEVTDSMERSCTIVFAGGFTHIHLKRFQ